MDTNVFLIATEHHFLLALSIIRENGFEKNFNNKLVLLGQRLKQVNKSALPAGVTAIDLHFDAEENFVQRVNLEILNGTVRNLFVVHAYRPAETYILSRVAKVTKRHLIQDGALFYNRIERSVFLNHFKNALQVYQGLWRKGIWFADSIFYGRFMETSGYIDELWMTHPEYYIGPKTKKPVHRVRLFPDRQSIQDFTNCFTIHGFELNGLDDCLIYLPVYIKQLDKVQSEIDCIKRLVKKSRKSNLLIKVHPNAFEAQYTALKLEFGDKVIHNNVAAEIYIALATNSMIVGCASTSLFFHNASCSYYALKHFYQKLGIFSHWYNVNLPGHVVVVDDIDEIPDR